MKPKINTIVFSVSALLTLLFVVLGALFPEQVFGVFGRVQALIIEHLGWWYVLSVGVFLVFVLVLFVSPFGGIRLGKQDERPEYGNATWFAMLFSAGMGIGLLFFSVAEPVLHFTAPRDAPPRTVAAAEEAMTVSFLHWGLHAWAIYIVIGLALAYFAYRHDLPLTIRSALYPLLGKRVDGAIGDAVEIMAVLGTLFGVATSLGLGAMQINSGLAYLGLVDEGVGTQLVLIAIITLIATASVASGLDRGVRRLSQLNLTIGLVLVTFVLIVGPTAFLISSFIEGIGRYLQNLVQLTLRTDALHGTEWQASWTMFYWAWWISWSPFVGMFIARISRGRTIREFIGGVLLVPTLLTFAWLTVFGNTALHMELFGAGGIAAAVEDSVSVALFVLLEQLPFAAVTVVISTLVIGMFFVTSADSGSLVIDKLTSGARPGRPAYQRVFWALIQGAVAIVLLLTGGLLALQTAVLTMALPFSFIMLAICYSLVQGLRTERSIGRKRAAPPAIPAATPPGAARFDHARDTWRGRLARAVETAEARGAQAPRPQRPEAYLQETVLPAFHSLRDELERHGRRVVLRHDAAEAVITVMRETAEEFSYGIRVRREHPMASAYPEMPDEIAEDEVHVAEVSVHDALQSAHAPADFGRDAIVTDFLEQYEKWAGW